VTEPTIAIQLDSDTAGEIRSVIRAGLNEYNFSHSPKTDVVPLTLTARNASNEIVGGLVGEMRPGWKWLYIAMLWIAEPYRKHGLGRRLIRAAEEEALRRGCRYAAVDTLSFQARGFYEKEGYKLFGVQEDYPPGCRRFYFQKELTIS
jgi:GNAT superfamily N-acetyltransferase